MSDQAARDGLLAQLERDVQATLDCCVADGLTEAEIRHAARPFLSAPKKRPTCRRLLVKRAIASVAVVLSLLLARESIEWRVCMYARLAMIALLPYWDWTPYHYEICLIANPLYQEKELTATDCQVCEDLRGVVRADGTESQDLLEDVVDNLIPVVVKEGLGDWPAMDPYFSIANITQAYLEDRKLREASICNFRSNLQHLGFDNFLRRLPAMDGGWFAHWENCDLAGQKHLRQFYRRPSFLPPAVELTRPNWVIASSGFAGRRFKQLYLEERSHLVWLAQVKGLNYVRLVPEDVCSDICPELELLLEAREILTVNTKLWKVLYLPGENSENMAFAAGGLTSG
ncbi:uncharacterized protein LOC144145320 [Haemaphysalis longicornis]